MYKKLIFLISLFLVFALLGTNACFAGTIDVQVSSGNDDAEEDIVTAGLMDLGSSDLELIHDEDSSSDQLVGIRFQDIGIPQGATITSAYELNTERQAALRNAIVNLTGADTACTFIQDIELIAGLRITIGPWMLQASLRDELKSFAEAANGI